MDGLDRSREGVAGLLAGAESGRGGAIADARQSSSGQRSSAPKTKPRAWGAKGGQGDLT